MVIWSSGDIAKGTCQKPGDLRNVKLITLAKKILSVRFCRDFRHIVDILWAESERVDSYLTIDTFDYRK